MTRLSEMSRDELIAHARRAAAGGEPSALVDLAGLLFHFDDTHGSDATHIEALAALDRAAAAGHELAAQGLAMVAPLLAPHIISAARLLRRSNDWED